MSEGELNDEVDVVGLELDTVENVALELVVKVKVVIEVLEVVVLELVNGEVEVALVEVINVVGVVD